MKKKVLFILLAVLCALMLVACLGEEEPPKTDDPISPSEPSEPEHTHTEVEIPAVAATCTEAGLTAGKKCSECGEITVAQETVEALGHDYNKDDKCNTCGSSIVYTEGLEFSLINNDTEYEVYGIGTCTDTKIYIPREYNGKPVTKISNYAFQKCFSLTSITIPNSVTIIGPSAFEDCSNLTSITIPDSVTSIGYAAFSGTQVIKIECGVSYVGKWLVECDTSVTSVKIKDGTVGIANYAFYNCSSLTSITIPDGVTSIGNDVFYNCTSLTSITIPDSVTSIGKNAFKDCKNLKDIYFTGTEEEWIAIGKGKDWNYNTGNYTIHYNYVP